MEEQDFEKLANRILNVINNSKHTYRTVRGIAKEASLDQSKVFKVIQTSKKIIKSRKRNQNMESLFTTKKKIESMSAAKQLRSIISGSI